MSIELHNQIYNELNLRETEDLLEIWYSNNHEEWSDIAFEVIKEILIKRLGEIPPQVETSNEEIQAEDFAEDEGFEEWEMKLIEDENQPEFYDTLEVLALKDNINRTAKAVIFIQVLSGLISIPYISNLVRPFFLNQGGFTPLIYLIAFIVSMLGAAVAIAITYFPLKALAHVLRILMEMEFNSRKAG